jgi:tetratricopeptide (TPR) repeat protein
MCLFILFLACFAGIVSKPVAAQDTNYARVSLAGRDWALEVQAPGFAVETHRALPDGRQYLLIGNRASKVELSIFLEGSQENKQGVDCPDHLQQTVKSVAKTGLSAEDVTSSEIDSMPVVEYMIHSVRELPVEQKNLIACETKDGVYVDIHISKTLFKPEDEHLLTDALNSLHFVTIEKKGYTISGGSARNPPSSAAGSAGNAATQGGSSKTSADYFAVGSRYYLARDFEGAIGPYQKALDLEKANPTLSKTYWRVLVDNLGMAYGISGDLDHSEETLKYGLSKDPGYPMFYYNLACVNAERGDMNKTMDYLRQAYALKANAIPGEGMPGPRTDDSFQRFMSNAQFKKFVDELVEGGK